MALSKRVFASEIIIRMNENGFVESFGVRKVQLLEDGTVLAEREQPAEPLTLEQVKNRVAAL